MKYLIFETPSGLDKVILFDEITDHVDMKNRMPDSWTLVSAGKIAMGDSGQMGTAIPTSVSLKIVYTQEAMLRDDELIQRTLRFRA